MRNIGPFQILNLLFAAMFVLSAVVQFNDPDPALWIAIYAAAATACFAYDRHPRAAWFPLVLLVVAVAWASVLLYRTAGDISFAELFQSMETKGGRVELAREGLGLLIVALWMAVLSRRGFRRNRTADTVRS